MIVHYLPVKQSQAWAYSLGPLLLQVDAPRVHAAGRQHGLHPEGEVRDGREARTLGGTPPLQPQEMAGHFRVYQCIVCVLDIFSVITL